MRAVVDLAFIVTILGMEVLSRPEAWVAMAGGALWLLLQIAFDPDNRSYHAYYFVATALFVGFILVYAFNPSHRLDGALGLVPLEFIFWLPGSAHAEMTHVSAGFAAKAAVIGGLGLRLGRGGLLVLLFLFMTSGLAMAALVLEQRWAPNQYQIFPRTGWFSYENHYAAFANLIFPLVLAAGLHCFYAARKKGWMAIGLPFFLAGAGLMVVSIYYARSRAALAISGLIVAAMVVQQIWHFARRSGRIQISRWLIIAPVAVAVLVVGWLGINRMWGTPSRLLGELGYRGQIVVDTLSILPDRPLWGTGPGTFVSVFPYYQSESISSRVVNQAHCDPAQFLIEYGMAGTALFAGILGWLMWRRPRPSQIASRYPSFLQLETSAMAIGLAGMMIHSLVDFPWRNGVLALMGFLYAAVWLGSGLRENTA